LSEPLVPDGSIVALDVRELLGLARLDVLYDDLPLKSSSK
jgi:hypothetical protein